MIVTIGYDQSQPHTFTYSATFHGETLLNESKLGVVVEEGGQQTTIDPARFHVTQTLHSTHTDRWQQPFGDRAEIPDNYNALTLVCHEAKGGRVVHIELRAYDEGFAHRLVFPDEGWNDASIVRDLTTFCLPEGCRAYEEHGTEGEYSISAIDDIEPKCQIPLTVVYPSGIYSAIAEAGVFDHAQMLLSSAQDGTNTLRCDLWGPMRMAAGFATPWRVVIAGRRPAELHDHNYLILNLNPPCALEDTSWIKPGKVLREITLSTRGGKACVDFAVKHNLQYVMFDAGWYGPENDEASDATSVNVDPKKAAPDAGPLDLAEVIDYANEHDVGIILYVNRRALKKQLDEIFPLYAKWGVKGVKLGFVDVGTQEAMSLIHKAVREAARCRLVVDIHDAYRPSGMSRTYPNLLTQEGVRGNEHMPTARHNATLPFTRFTTGAADYTICYYTPRIKTTHAHQLAASVIFFSPLQCLFWYDRPEAYQGEKEVEFFAALPTVWDETRVIHDEIGEVATIARRRGDEWFVGTITNEESRSVSIALDFLKPDTLYVAHLYTDDANAGSERTGVRADTARVSSTTVWRTELAPSGGAALRLVPEQSIFE